MINDPWYNRFQIEFGVRFDLLPNEEMNFKQWLFDPFAGLTLPNQVLTNPRAQLPKIRHWVEEVGEGTNEHGMKNWKWVSRALWLRFGIRILGLDVGFGLAWRKKAVD